MFDLVAYEYDFVGRGVGNDAKVINPDGEWVYPKYETEEIVDGEYTNVLPEGVVPSILKSRFVKEGGFSLHSIGPKGLEQHEIRAAWLFDSKRVADHWRVRDPLGEWDDGWSYIWEERLDRANPNRPGAKERRDRKELKRQQHVEKYAPPINERLRKDYEARQAAKEAKKANPVKPTVMPEPAKPAEPKGKAWVMKRAWVIARELAGGSKGSKSFLSQAMKQAWAESRV